jgi:hypothetical protein
MGTTSVANMRKGSMESQDEIPWVMTILIGMAAGIVAIVIYAWDEASWGVFACALVIAAAAGIAGALIGFIFGIPKSSATASSTTTAGTRTATAEYQGNSNLEQISDWLTKILVGAGLVQLGAIRKEFNDLGSRFGTHGPLGSSGWVVGPAVMVAYGVSGFLLAYLWARIYMAQALAAGNAGDIRDAKEALSHDVQPENKPVAQVNADAAGAHASAGTVPAPDSVT